MDTLDPRKRLKLAAVGFTVLWSSAMFWWSGDYTIVNAVILTVCGIFAGFAWYWAMSKFQRQQNA
jgi:glycopeptide antibiotics resistance protein